MKKTITLALLLVISFAKAQVFKGKGDKKLNVGLNMQKGGTGIQASSDFGVGENLSYGFVVNYLLSVKNGFMDSKPEFRNRVDLRARINANIANVFKIEKKFDIYPGLDLGLHNFGGHLGVRYFITDAFQVFSEIGFPISKYGNKNDKEFRHLNNQFATTIGVSFAL